MPRRCGLDAVRGISLPAIITRGFRDTVAAPLLLFHRREIRFIRATTMTRYSSHAAGVRLGPVKIAFALRDSVRRDMFFLHRAELRSRRLHRHKCSDARQFGPVRGNVM